MGPAWYRSTGRAARVLTYHPDRFLHSINNSEYIDILQPIQFTVVNVLLYMYCCKLNRLKNVDIFGINIQREVAQREVAVEGGLLTNADRISDKVNMRTTVNMHAQT